MQTVQTAPIVRQLKYALKANKDRNVYIGSGEKARHLARSPLAMPYELRVVNWKDDAERDEKIGQYKMWLWRIMKDEKDPRHAAVWTELRKLRQDSILLCYCYPRNCHGHVIVAAWKWAVANGKIDAPRSEPPMQQTMNKAVDEERMQSIARANAKELAPPHTALGPLDMTSIMARLAEQQYPNLTGTDPSLEGISKEVLAAHGIFDKPSTLLNPPPPCMDHEEFTKEDIAYIMDRRLDEEILAEHVTTCPDCDAPKYIHLAHHHAGCPCEDCHYQAQRSVPPAKPTRTRRPRLSFDEPRSLVWNEYDDVTADMTDLYTFDASFDRESLALDAHPAHAA